MFNDYLNIWLSINVGSFWKCKFILKPPWLSRIILLDIYITGVCGSEPRFTFGENWIFNEPSFFSHSTTAHKPLTSHSLMNLTKFGNSSKWINRLGVVRKGTRSSLTPCSSCKKGKRAVEGRTLEIIPHFSATQVEILEDRSTSREWGKLNSISDASGTRLLKSLFTGHMA